MALGLGVAGALVGAVLSWAQLRTSVATMAEKLGRIERELDELRGSRDKMGERIGQAERAVERVRDRVDFSDGELTPRPIRPGRTG